MTDKELVDWLRNCSIYEGRAFLRQSADRIEALKAEIERLRGHAVHSLSCSLANYGEPVECTCGLTALIKEIEGDWR